MRSSTCQVIKPNGTPLQHAIAYIRVRNKSGWSMNYQTFSPHPNLASLVSCYWTLEVPAAPVAQRQRIVPDGCIEMAFILGDDIKRYTQHDLFML